MAMLAVAVSTDLYLFNGRCASAVWRLAIVAHHHFLAL